MNIHLPIDMHVFVQLDYHCFLKNSDFFVKYVRPIFVFNLLAVELEFLLFSYNLFSKQNLF